MLGQMFMTDNNFDEAARYLSKAEQLMPDFVRNGRVKILEREAAQQDSGSTGAGNSPHTPDYAVGRANEDRSQWDAAIAAYQKDLQTFPNDAAAWFGIGNCAMGKTDYTSAAAAYQKAIDLQPKYAEAYLNLGKALAQLHRDKEALAAIQTAREIDPTVIRHIPGLLETTAEQMRAAQTQKQQ